MKVLVCVKSLDGGTGTYALSLKKLQTENLHITIVALEKPQHRTIRNKISYFAKKKYPSVYGFSTLNILRLYKEFFWIKKKIQNVSPDIVLSIDMHCNLLSIIATKIIVKKPRLIITTHNNVTSALQTKSTRPLFFFLKMCITFFYNMTPEHIAISQDLATAIEKEFKLKKKPQVIYYGTEVQNRSIIYTPSIMTPPTLISAGRLVEQKDFKTLIKTLTCLKNDTKLLIAGDGPQRQELSVLAHSLHVQKKVHFLGWRNLHQVFRQYPQSIFVLSSKWEGLSYVLLEAMTHGIPVIASDCNFGPREILRNGKFGILVELGNVQQFAQAITYLSHKTTYIRYAKKSLQRASFFTEKKMLQEYRLLFQGNKLE